MNICYKLCSKSLLKQLHRIKILHIEIIDNAGRKNNNSVWLVINQLGSPWFYEKFDIFKCPHQGLKINVIYVWPLNRTPARSHRRRFFPSDNASEKSENLGGEGYKELEGLLRTRFYFWFCQNWGGGDMRPFDPRFRRPCAPQNDHRPHSWPRFVCASFWKSTHVPLPAKEPREDRN